MAERDAMPNGHEGMRQEPLAGRPASHVVTVLRDGCKEEAYCGLGPCALVRFGEPVARTACTSRCMEMLSMVKSMSEYVERASSASSSLHSSPATAAKAGGRWAAPSAKSVRGISLERV